MVESEIHPLHDQILIRLAEPEKVTDSGLHIPEKAQDKLPQKAVVEAVGSGRVLKNGTVVPLNVKVGDTVLVERWHGQTIEDSMKRLIVKEDSILAVLEEALRVPAEAESMPEAFFPDISQDARDAHDRELFGVLLRRAKSLSGEGS